MFLGGVRDLMPKKRLVVVSRRNWAVQLDRLRQNASDGSLGGILLLFYQTIRGYVVYKTMVDRCVDFDEGDAGQNNP